MLKSSPILSMASSATRTPWVTRYIARVLHHSNGIRISCSYLTQQVSMESMLSLTCGLSAGLLCSSGLHVVLHTETATIKQEALGRGSVQYLSAGSGIVHSEMNEHTADTTRFLQIWLTPDKRGVKPQAIHPLLTHLACLNPETPAFHQPADLTLPPVCCSTDPRCFRMAIGATSCCTCSRAIHRRRSGRMSMSSLPTCRSTRCSLEMHALWAR